MAAGLVFAIASDREVGDVRERGEKIEQPARIGTLHLALILARKRLPACRIVFGALSHFQQGLTRCDAGNPDVVEVARRERLFPYTAPLRCRS